MRKDFGRQPWLYPMPVMIVSAYGENGVPVSMAVGWGGILDPDHIAMCVMNYHKTTVAIENSGAFTVSIADYAHIEACDYVGTVSGNDVPDKNERCGFHTTKSQYVNAPVITELPVALECTLVSYDGKTGRLIGRIVNVSADEAVLDEEGRIDADKFEVLTYDPVRSAYRKLGALVGTATKVCRPL